MNKNLSYESPEIFVEKFICEEGVLSSYRFGDAEDDGWDVAGPEAMATSYEAFFYGNMTEY